MRAHLFALWLVAVPALAGGPNYDAFSDAEGHIGAPDRQTSILRRQSEHEEPDHLGAKHECRDPAAKRSRLRCERIRGQDSEERKRRQEESAA